MDGIDTTQSSSTAKYIIRKTVHVYTAFRRPISIRESIADTTAEVNHTIR
jgi:hypothetical protein